MHVKDLPLRLRAMGSLVEALCSERCAGRAPGTPEGAATRAEILAALRTAGLDPFEQAVPGIGGHGAANVLARIPGDIDRYVLVAAHHDHLGRAGSKVYWGADDNAAAVAILVEVGRRLAAHRPMGRGVILAAFDTEEPPHFLTGTMGSEHFARSPIVPLQKIDLMICMDLVGHALGGDDGPAEVSRTLFALGAERSEGTPERLAALARSEPGLIVRPIDAEAIPPLSDYYAFWRRSVPFLFLTAGRWRRYHTPDDRPEALAWEKMLATAGWLERMVRDTCARPEAQIRCLPEARDDASTLRTLKEMLSAGRAHPAAAALGAHAPVLDQLLASCDKKGRLPASLRDRSTILLGALEAALR